MQAHTQPKGMILQPLEWGVRHLWVKSVTKAINKVDSGILILFHRKVLQILRQEAAESLKNECTIKLSTVNFFIPN